MNGEYSDLSQYIHYFPNEQLISYVYVSTVVNHVKVKYSYQLDEIPKWSRRSKHV